MKWGNNNLLAINLAHTDKFSEICYDFNVSNSNCNCLRSSSELSKFIGLILVAAIGYKFQNPVSILKSEW